MINTSKETNPDGLKRFGKGIESIEIKISLRMPYVKFGENAEVPLDRAIAMFKQQINQKK
jgi:hypothetical protein